MNFLKTTAIILAFLAVSISIASCVFQEPKSSSNGPTKVSLPEEISIAKPGDTMYLHQFGDTLYMGYAPFDSTDKLVVVIE